MKTSINKLPNDTYFTKDTLRFMDILHKHIPNDLKVIVEPSAGNGDFIPVINTFNYKKLICYDITDYNIKSKYSDYKIKVIIKDFMDNKLKDRNNKINLIIGNPPFGKNNNLANRFIKESCRLEAEYIALILPASFKKVNVYKKVFDKHYKLLHSEDYNEFYYVIDNQIKDYKINCVFQIWKYEKEYIRDDTDHENKKTNKYFKYINKSNKNQEIEEDNIYSIRRVGSRCPEITKGEHISKQDHYYIVFNPEIDINAFIEEYNKIKFDFSDCTNRLNITKSKLNWYIDNNINYELVINNVNK